MVLINGFLQAEISAKGAELKRLTGQNDKHEYLWSGDQRYWPKTSPVLFPIVGELKDGTYFYNRKSYQLPRHGFARDHVFEEKQLSDTEAVFTLKDTQETRNVYPFSFRLLLRYKLIGPTLRCTYEVSNPSNDQPLLFSIGGHPAFAVATPGSNGAYDSHYLEFPEDDILHCHTLKGNLIANRVNTLELDNHLLPLRYELFYDDALVLKTLRSRKISLRNHASERGIHFRYDDFPFFGIWAAKGADFVCLEPWCGIADSVESNQQLEHKEGIQHLEPRSTWKRSWEVACF